MATRRKKDAPARLDLLKAISTKISGLTTVDHVEKVGYVRTIFTGLNRAIELGGWPRKGVSLVHGPNSKGKTVLVIGVLVSFDAAQNVAIFNDVERATDDRWLKALTAGHHGIGYRKPRNMNELERQTHDELEKLTALKNKKQIPRDVSYIAAVDTISKLIPQTMMEKLYEKGVKGGYQEKAGAQTLWLQELIPLLDDNDGHMVFVAQERQNFDAGQFGAKHRIAVPEAFKFDNGLRIRCSWAKALKIGELEVGYEHHASVEKNKVGPGGGEFVFYTSNGRGDCPPGFDHARDIVSECKLRGGDFYSENETRDGKYIVSTVGGETLKVKGEKEWRRIIRDGMIETYRTALNEHIPYYLDSLKAGDDGDR